MTASGRKVHPLDPDPATIDLGDVAHGLSNICRFNGHVSAFLSVAQHSVLVARELPECTRYALLHDAAEYVLCDLPRPLKRHPQFSFYREAEAHLSAVIYRRFNIVPEPEWIASLAYVDHRMLRTEQRDLMPPALADEGRDDVEPYLYTITPWCADMARELFLTAWKEATT